jgi:hypothetical protein
MPMGVRVSCSRPLLALRSELRHGRVSDPVIMPAVLRSVVAWSRKWSYRAWPGKGGLQVRAMLSQEGAFSCSTTGSRCATTACGPQLVTIRSPGPEYDPAPRMSVPEREFPRRKLWREVGRR